MIFEIRGKKYRFDENFTRFIDRGDKVIVHNAPDHVIDKDVLDRVDLTPSGFSHLTVPAGRLSEYEVK